MWYKNCVLQWQQGKENHFFFSQNCLFALKIPSSFSSSFDPSKLLTAFLTIKYYSKQDKLASEVTITVFSEFLVQSVNKNVIFHTSFTITVGMVEDSVNEFQSEKIYSSCMQSFTTGIWQNIWTRQNCFLFLIWTVNYCLNKGMTSAKTFDP